MSMKLKKTERTYGLVVKEILRVARQCESFTIDDVPGIARRRTASQVQNLTSAGVLIRIAPGRRGRFGHARAVYSIWANDGTHAPRKEKL